MDEARVKYLLSKGLDELFCYLGRGEALQCTQHQPALTRPRTPRTHVMHRQPLAPDGLHIVDLAAGAEVGSEHALGRARGWAQQARRCAHPKGLAQPTLLDLSQCTRGTTT